MKNANLKSEDEMYNMLLSGIHLFDDEGNELCFNKARVFSGLSPFEIIFNDGTLGSVKGFWRSFAQMQIKQKWQDSISKETPKLCRVWDSDNEKAGNVYKVIDCYKTDLDLPYRVIWFADVGYKHAEPVTPDSEFLYREED